MAVGCKAIPEVFGVFPTFWTNFCHDVRHWLWTHAQRASMLYFATVFYIFFIPALVGQTAERIFTKLSHVVDIRHHLRTY